MEFEDKETKICKKCGRELPLERFRLSSANGVKYYRGACSHIDINLPNVENGVDFIAELKKPKVQKAMRAVIIDPLVGGSKLGINRFK